MSTYTYMSHHLKFGFLFKLVQNVCFLFLRYYCFKNRILNFNLKDEKRRTDKICCHQKYMYEESTRVKRAHKMHISILYLNLQIKNFLSLSHSSFIHIKNILKNQDRTAAIAIAAFIHIYIHNFQCFCSPDMMPAYLNEKELDRVEKKWNSEQVDRRNKRRNITTHTYIYIYKCYERENSSRIKNITLVRQKKNSL